MLTAATGGLDTSTVVGLIVVPSVLFAIGLIIAAIKGSIRFAQYMVRSEEAQASTAKTNQEIAHTLESFMSEVRGSLKEHDTRLSLLEYAQRFGQTIQIHPPRGDE